MRWTGFILGVAACSSTPAPAPLRNVPESGPAQDLTFRRLSTGAIMRSSTLTTYTLRRSGPQATLEVTEATAPNSIDDELFPEVIRGPFTQGTPKQYAGPVVDRGAGAFELDLTGGGERIALACKPTKLDVAAATAARAHSPDAGECGDEGVWRPAATVAIDVIACTSLDPDKAAHGGQMFAPSPGVEYLFVNDDCFQGGGFRLVAKGGTLGNVRAPSKH